MTARAFASSSAETSGRGAAWARLSAAALFQFLRRWSLSSRIILLSIFQPDFVLQSCAWLADEKDAEEEEADAASVRLRQRLGVIVDDAGWSASSGGGEGAVPTPAGAVPGGCSGICAGPCESFKCSSGSRAECSC